MAREAKRQFLRIASNYTRLGATLVLGVILTKVQFDWLGVDGFGLIALLMATIGLGAMSADITRQSLIRELSAWYRRDDTRFLASYNAAYVLSAGAAALTMVGFAVVILIIPILNIPEEHVGAARIFAAAHGVSISIRILFGPAMAMYLVRERFVLRNISMTIMRANLLIAAGYLFWIAKVEDVGRGIMLFGLLAAVMDLLVFFAFAAPIIASDRRLIPRPWSATRAAMREVGGTFSWNTGIIFAGNLHERAAAIIMNLVFGVWGNTVYGLALRLTSYVRMATAGMTYGVDASTARIAESGTERLAKLIRHSTRLHALTAAPAGVLVWVLAEPLFHLWVGSGVDDPDAVLPPAAALVRIMVLGLVVRAISDGWLRILYGAGLIRSYAPIVILGGFANPILVGILILALPGSYDYSAVGWAYSAVFVLVHGWVAPARGARALGLSLKEFYLPTLRPFAAALFASSGLLLGRLVNDDPNSASRVLGSVAGFGVVYAALGASLVLTQEERDRILCKLRIRHARGGSCM